MRTSRPRTVILGGGVAALEAVLALRALTGKRAAITMLAPERQFSPPAVSVAMPFGFGPPPSLPLVPFADRYDVDLKQGFLERVDRVARTVIPSAGEPIPYDHLLVAVGARRRAAVRGALTFRGPYDAEAVEDPLADVVAGRASSLAIAVPSSATWSLPAYELAIMAAVELRSRGVDAPAVSVVTPEAHPLEVFGAAAGEAVTELLDERGIEFHGGCSPTAFLDGELRMRDGRALPVDRVVALPEAVGPFVPGLPSDGLGFLPTDAHARVTACVDIYAAGDATTFPLRQGGLATQQADAAAESIAHRMGVVAHPQPFRPVLRGVLLTGGGPLYLRAVLDAGPSCDVGRRPLWSPPAKVAGRYLGPLMATARPVELTTTPLQDLGYSDEPDGLVGA